MTCGKERPVGVFGGTFDPVHFGHLRTALELGQTLQLEEVRMLPSAVPPHRDSPSVSAQQRLDMLQLAVADEPLFRVDPRELEREGPSYMVDTLSSLRRELGSERPLCLLLGLDAFLGLPGWYHWQALIELAHIVVTHRPGWQLTGEGDNEAVALLAERRCEQVEELHARPAGRIMLQAVTRLEISASHMRTLLGAGYSIRYLTPEPVRRYIEEHELYRKTDEYR